MKKRMIMMIAISLICFFAIVGGTIAYYTKEATAKNVVSASNVKIRLNILDKDNNDQSTSRIEIMPGITQERVVSVTNIGKEPAWIRIQANVKLDDKTYQMKEDGSLEGEDKISIKEINTLDWIYKDGFFYYKEILNPNETTSILFEEILFDKKMDNAYADKDLRLNIEAYGTQSKHNGETVLEAKGWPSE